MKFKLGAVVTGAERGKRGKEAKTNKIHRRCDRKEEGMRVRDGNGWAKRSGNEEV